MNVDTSRMRVGASVDEPVTSRPRLSQPSASSALATALSRPREDTPETIVEPNVVRRRSSLAPALPRSHDEAFDPSAASSADGPSSSRARVSLAPALPRAALEHPEEPRYLDQLV